LKVITRIGLISIQPDSLFGAPTSATVVQCDRYSAVKLFSKYSNQCDHDT